MESTNFSYYDPTYYNPSDYNLTYDNFTDDAPRKGHELYLLQERMRIFSKIACSLIFVLGTLGNGLVIFITGYRLKRTVNTTWILNLAIADFTFSLFLPLGIVNNDQGYQGPLDHIKCEFSHVAVYFNLFASVYILVVISVDRCVAVCCPVWARNHRTPRLASFVALGVWILALFLCSLKLYFTKSFIWHRNKTLCIQLDDYQLPRDDSHTFVWDSIRFVLGFIIPFAVIVGCYGAIVVKLRRDRLSRSSKPFKVITAVTVAFFVCWFPLHFFFMFHILAYRDETRGTLMLALPLVSNLAFFNSCLNPILYFCVGYNVKETLRCSLFSALDNAFTEDSNQSQTNRSNEPSTELESYNL